MSLEFTKTEVVEELFRARVSGSCPLCSVPASRAFPILRLWDEEVVVFEGCAGCLDSRVHALPEARALLRVVLWVARGPRHQEDGVATA